MKPIVTEKAMIRLEAENVISFEVEKEKTKDEIKKEVESLFDVKVKKVRTLIRNNKKVAHVQLDKKNPAIDLATKLGIM